MIRGIAANLARVVFYLALQVFILNNIGLGGFINPYLYILPILLFPLATPAWLAQLASFAIGMAVDLAVGTPGMHAAATTTVGFLRPIILRRTAPRDGYDSDTTPTARDLGLQWFLKYAGVLTVIHHTMLFSVESFSLTSWWRVLARTALSSIFTLALIVATQYLSSSGRRSHRR